MPIQNTLPSLGGLLRGIITQAGWRSYIVERGLDKDLDDLANETRSGSLYDLLINIEEECRRGIAAQCGWNWSNLLTVVWRETRTSIQDFSQNAATSPFPKDQGKALVQDVLEDPLLATALLNIASQVPGPDLGDWLEAPFVTWLGYASTQSGVPQQELLSNLANHLNLDDSTIRRWKKGSPISKLPWPHREAVFASLGECQPETLSPSLIDRLTGWLTVTVAVQGVAGERRRAIGRRLPRIRLMGWSVSDAAADVNRRAETAGASETRDVAVPLLFKIQDDFAGQPDLLQVDRGLKQFQELIRLAPKAERCKYQYIHDWFAARLAALSGRPDEANRLYDNAVRGVWWDGGQNQQPIIDEALRHSVGTGAKVMANRLWDLTYMLGLNNGEKRRLDDQDQRRIAFGFEKMFFPLKAKPRIPPAVEFLVGESAWTYSLTRDDLRNPNGKKKFAEGRSRRTPLMEAIKLGTLDDVKRLLDAGGDPNDYIPETGEGPLSYALRRACDRKDPEILDHLLTIDLSAETVNRPASSKRETPLKIAIEMANARAAERLIELGADVEARCCYSPSALCYLMLLLQMSLHPDDRTADYQYILGKGPAEAYDAKDGAVLGVDLAMRRQAMLAGTRLSPLSAYLYEAARKDAIRPPQEYKAVLWTLLEYGADPNRRYKVEYSHLAEWTPTLVAAEIGDVEVFKKLIEHGGDPRLTLMDASPLQRYDALWVAVGYNNEAVVRFLIEHFQSERPQ